MSDFVTCMAEVCERLDTNEARAIESTYVVYYHDEPYCLDCALVYAFDSSFQAVYDAFCNETFLAADGSPLILIHEDSIQYHTGPAEEWYPDGEYCSKCEAELIAPYEGE